MEEEEQVKMERSRRKVQRLSKAVNSSYCRPKVTTIRRNEKLPATIEGEKSGGSPDNNREYHERGNEARRGERKRIARTIRKKKKKIQHSLHLACEPSTEPTTISSSGGGHGSRSIDQHQRPHEVVRFAMLCVK
jgi:hypothetical protein